MSSLADIPTLHVEGKDDEHTIIHLLKRFGIDMSEAHRPFRILTSKDPITGAEGVEHLLATMADAIRNATDRPVGFVLDVDVEVADRWNAVCTKLREAGLAPPPACPGEGYFGQLSGYPHQVGVWMMPDCVSDHGKLEHLLETLVPAGDRLWPHAEECTYQAKKLGARFSDNDRAKAVTHCWLAWQQDPGKPFGVAIGAKFFSHDSPEAMAFLRWLGRLFDLPNLTAD